MSILDLDVGNTRLKWRYASDPVARGAIARAADSAEVDKLVDGLPRALAPGRIRVCSVGGAEFGSALSAALLRRFGVQSEFARVVPQLGEVRCGYRNPTQLGVDRWLAVLAAWQRHRCAAIVVDAGSACTVDILWPNGEHRGGYIVPGLAMMAAALFGRTAQVKVAPSFDGGCVGPGRRTEDAVAHGALAMLADFVQGCVARLEAEVGAAPMLVIGGGDAARLQAVIDAPVDVRDDLVFEGLAIALP